MSYQSQRPPSLVMRRGPRPNQAFPLHKTVLTLGRAADNDIVVDDAEVSRHHARLTLRGNDWILEDLNSRNGTLVNGQRITSPVVLTPGSQIALGPDVLFSMEGGVPVAAMPRRPAARRGGSRWLLLAGLAVLALVLAGAAVLAYFYLNPPIIEARDTAELFSTGPDIAFQEPAPGTQVGLGGSVLVFATARDEDKVTRVDLWVDDQLVVQQVSPDFDGVTPLSLIHKLVAVTPGMHSLVVRAYDSLGAMGESPTLYVTVLEEPEPAPATVQYVVQPGDTPATVALVMSTTVVVIQGENPGMGQVITPGQTIVVPAPPPPQPKEPKPQPDAPPPGGQGPVAGGPGADQKKPPGLVPADIIPDPGLLAPGVAQIDPAQIQFPIGGILLDPPQAVKAPTWKKVEAGDCTVTLSWQAGQQDEKYKISREPFPAGVGNRHWMDVPQGQMTYTDKVPSPGQYRYQVVATTEIKGRGFETKSSYETVTVSPSAKCIPSSQYKLVHFQPIEFKSKYKEGALFVTVGNVDARRVPPSDGKHYPAGDWSSKKVEEVWPAPVSVYLNPDEPVRLEVSGEGKEEAGKPPSLGSFAQAHPQSEMGPGKKLTGGNADFQLTYYFWLEDVQWGKRKTTNSIKAPVLHLAEKTEDLKNRIVYRCRGCNPKTSRVLFWDWTGNKDAIEGYILYRGYSCPGQEGESKAPLVLRKEYQGINIPPQTEPVGCVARYQVSAFGRAGESDLSKELVLDTAPAVSRVKVTFIDLLLSQPTTDQIRLQANQYHRTSEEMAIPDQSLKLKEVRFGGKEPNNALTVNLDQGETLQVSLLVGTRKLEPSKPLDPTKPGIYPIHFQGNQEQCWGTVEIGVLETVSAGEKARPEADISFMAPSLSGKDVYVQLGSLGPDLLAANRVKVESYWVTPGTKDKPLSPKQTIERWWPSLAETVEIKVGSVSDIKGKDPKEVEFHVKVIALDFTDPYESNNVWQGKIPDLIPLIGDEPASPPKKRNLENGYKCTTNDECKSGYCADKQRCAPLAGQDGDYCHSHDHCEGFCLCDSGNDGKYCIGWESWPSGDSIWFKVGLMRGVEDYGVCRGKGENGAPCYANKDCASNNCVETNEGGGIKRCTPQNREGKGGEYCHHDDQCESRYCVSCGKTDRCWDPGICAPKLFNGARCEWNETCQSDYCDDGRCAPPKGTGQAGEYCHHDNHCESRFCVCPTGYDGKFCKDWGRDDIMSKFGHGTCLARDKNGAPCNRNEECESVYCDDGKCAPKPGTGKPGKYCHRDEHCQSDFCISGTCYQLADLGDVCRKHSECESGYCADTFLGGGWGRCAPEDGEGQPGEYCHHNNHCASGECICRSDWWRFGFCANWDGWGRGSVKGKCK